MQLLTVLVGDYGATSSSGICIPSLARWFSAAGELVWCTGSYHNSAFVDAPHNGGSGRGSFGEGQALGVQRIVAGIVGEVEARHRGVWGGGFGGVLMDGMVS